MSLLTGSPATTGTSAVATDVTADPQNPSWPSSPFHQLFDGPDTPVRFSCTGWPESAELTAGEYQLRLNKTHNAWAYRRAGCERWFSDEGSESRYKVSFV